MNFFYTIAIIFYYLTILIVSPFNKKAKLWIKGRKRLFKNLKNQVNNLNKIAWFHCASLGEFEQGRPIIEAFRKRHPEYKILLTFFSPSGYEIRKNYSGADYIFYLPLDTKYNAKQFLDIVKPEFVVFIKYEFWFNLFNELNKLNIPIYVASAIFREDQHFFKWYGGWFRKKLSKTKFLFVQNKKSVELLNSINITNVDITGDTRFDRVYQVASNPQSYPKIEKFIQDTIIVIGGSTWYEDEEILISVINKNLDGIKYFIVPHEINTNRISEIVSKIKYKTVLYSEIEKSDVANAKVLIIDTIGMLSNLYQYANLAIIGGGFGKGIHNVLEAAVFGMPIMFGPNYKKFQEAKDLIALGAAFTIKNDEDFYSKLIEIFSDHKVLEYCSLASKEYVKVKKGATDLIISKIESFL